jgi:hypothetical protein
MQVAAPILMDLGVRQVIRHLFGTLRALDRVTQLGPRELAVDHAQVIGAGRQSLTQLCHPFARPSPPMFPVPLRGPFLCAERESVFDRKRFQAGLTLRSRSLATLLLDQFKPVFQIANQRIMSMQILLLSTPGCRRFFNQLSKRRITLCGRSS